MSCIFHRVPAFCVGINVGTMAKLTAKFVENVTKPGTYADGSDGLRLKVSGAGAKSWVQRFTIKGQRRVDRGLGSAKYVSLKEARVLAFENAKLGRQGIDPNTLKANAKAQITFAEAALKISAELQGTYKNSKDHEAFLNSLRTHVFPELGEISIANISTAQIRQVLLTCRDRIPSGAKKVQQRIKRVFTWAVAEGIRADNPALPELLALPAIKTVVRNQPSLRYTKVPAFLLKLRASNAALSTINVVEFLILTACRSSEARGASWSEFDLEADIPIWTLPASRTKMARQHRVPLSPRAVEIIRHQHDMLGYDAVLFPGMKAGKPLTDMALLKLVKRIGGAITVHGFRTSFRTWAQEKTTVSSDVAEAALAHSALSTVKAAYARSDLFEKRYKLMCDWATHCAAAAPDQPA